MKIRWKIIIFQIIWLCFNFANCSENQTVNEYIRNRMNFVKNFTKTLSSNDIDIEYKSLILRMKIDTNNVKVIKSVENFIFLLSNNELYAVNLTNSQSVNFQFVGKLTEDDGTIEHIEITFWETILVIVTSNGRQIFVYVVNRDFNIPQHIEFINRIELTSPLSVLKLLKRKDELFMVALLRNDRISKQINLYHWKLSFFSLVDHQNIEIPDRNEIHDFDKLKILMIVGQESNVILQMLRIQQPSNTIIKLQKRSFKLDNFFHYEFGGMLFLKGCSEQAPCGTYKWSDTHFVRHSKIKKNFFQNILGIYNRYNIIIKQTAENNLMFYMSDDIDVEPSLEVNFSKSNLSDFSIFKVAKNDKIYFVTYNKSDENVYEIRFHKLKLLRPDTFDFRIDRKQDDLKQNVGNLKELLKYRLKFLDSIKQQVVLLKPLKHEPSLDNKKIIRANYANIRQSKIKRLKIAQNVSWTGDEIREKVKNINMQVDTTLQKFDVLNSVGDARDQTENQWENKIITRNLIYRGNQDEFKDFLLKSDPKIFQGDLVIQKLETKKLTVTENRINDVNFSELLQIKDFTGDKKIPGQKTFKNLNVNELRDVETLNEVNFNEFLREKQELGKDHYEFIADLKVRNLITDKINGVLWTKFLNDLYIRNKQTKLSGNLVFTNFSKVNDLIVESLGPVPVTSLMTTSTDQEILSNVFISKFHAENLKTNFINNEKWAENVAVTDQVNTIESPTQFASLHVRNQLTIKDKEGNESRASENREKTYDLIKRHVIGTKIEDLMQIYNNGVRIKGSLTLRNVNVEQLRGNIKIADSVVPLNISHVYWMKNFDQEIRVPNFQFQQPVEAIHVTTKLLNSHPAKSYLPLNSAEPPGIVNLVIQNGVVERNVINVKPTIPSLLSTLNSLVVRRGETSEIFGPVIFNEKLTVQNINVNSINNRSLATLVTSNKPQIFFTGYVHVKSLNITSFLVENKIKITNYNSVNLESFVENFVRVDQPTHFDYLMIENFKCENFSVNKFEKYDFEEFYGHLENELTNGSVNNRKTVNIYGDVIFSDLKLETFNNNQNVPELLSLIVLKNQSEAVIIGGVKTFKEDIELEHNLNVDIINNLNFDNFTKNVLLKSEKQTITGSWLIQNLQVETVKIQNLNGIKNIRLIDKKSDNEGLSVNLEIDELFVQNLQTASVNLDVNQIIDILRNPRKINWGLVVGKVGTTMPMVESTLIHEILSFGVIKSGPPQTITGSVEFVGENVTFSLIGKSDYKIQLPDNGDVDLKILRDDSLKSFSLEPQIIRSDITFMQPVYMTNLIMDELTGFLHVKIINDINIRQFNQSIFRFSDPLTRGVKVFREPVIIDELIVVDGLINDVAINSMVFIENNQNSFRNLKISNVRADNVKTENLNGFVLEKFLRSRMRKTGEQQDVKKHLIFEWLEISGDSKLSSINGVFVDDIVYSKIDESQEITGHKIIAGDLKLVGPSAINFINDINFLDMFKSIVRYNQNYVANYLQLPQTQLENGLIVTNSMNQRNIGDIIFSDQQTSTIQNLQNLIPHIKSKISTIKNRLRDSNRKLLYMDYDPNINIVYRSDDRSLDASSCRQQIELTPAPNRLNLNIVKKRAVEFDSVLSINLTVTTSLTDHKCDDVFANNNVNWIGLNWNNNGQSAFRNFTFPNHINDIKFLEPINSNYIFMIVVFENSGHEPNSLIIFEMDKTLNTWKIKMELTDMFHGNVITAVVNTNENQFLLVSSFKDNEPSLDDCLHIFKYERNLNKFVAISKILEKFDLMLDVTVDMKKMNTSVGYTTFLLLAKKDSKKLSIYQYKTGDADDNGSELRFYTKFLYEAGIVEIIVLYIEKDPYFIVGLKDGYFYIYEWRGIEGWLQLQYGYFENIKQMQPYKYNENLHLFLLSARKSATALSIYKQGRF